MSRRPWMTQGLELAVLSAFACAQPLFDLLGHQATFFVAHRTSAPGILVFAAVLLLGPPLVLLGAVRLLSLVSERLGLAWHRTSLGLLAGLTVAPPLARALPLEWIGWVLVVAGLTALTVVTHARWSRLRSAASWALVAPAGFAVMFLLGSPVRDLVFPPASGGARAIARARVPVVLLVFDELPLAALLRPDGSLDEARFPNFARLARQSTWYPNATTNADGTVNALPAILTGRWLRSEQLPTAQAHPNNLLTYFGRSYPMHASEFVTALCAEDVCGATQASFGLAGLLKDTAVVYLHATLPTRLAAAYLPSIGSRWAGFDGADGEAVASPTTVASAIEAATAATNEPERFQRLVRALAPATTPRLWYLHLGLPHVPWHLLPDGQAYHGAVVGGLTPQEIWQPDQRAVDHGLQRFLLQLSAVDRLLGQLLDRLHETGLDANALVVVTADHGASFRAGASRRDYDAAHPEDILPVPLFVRYPGQSEGRRDARAAGLVDVVPTIADVLDMPLPWPVDGQSLRRSAAPEGPRHLFTRLQGLVLPAHVPGERLQLSSRIEALFGAGGQADDLYRMGPHRDLLGLAVAPGGVPSPPGLDLRIDQPEALANVDPGGALVPAMLTASIVGPLPPGTPVAVTVNDTVAGLGWTLGGDGNARLTVMLAPRFFRPGRNAVAVYRVEANRSLSLIGRSRQADYQLVVERPGAPVTGILTPDGQTLPVQAGTVQGHVERIARTDSTWQLGGWVLDLPGRRTPDLFLVTQRRRIVATSLPWPRDDVAAYFKMPALRACGLQVSTILDGDGDLEVYAILGDSAYRMPILPQ